MFSYTVALEVNTAVFNEACSKIEKGLSNLKKNEVLDDVDGTKIQIYWASAKKIKVVNDYLVDAVYVDSEIDLNGIIESIV